MYNHRWGIYDYDVYNGSINHITIVNGCMGLKNKLIVYGGFLSHGGTPKSSRNMSDFPL